MLSLQNFRNFTFCRDTDTSRRRGRYLEKLKWFVTVSRNSIVLIISSLIAYVLKEVCDLKDSVDTTGDVPAGIPAWNLPWRFNSTKSEEDTGPIELANGFGVGLLMLPLVSMIQIIAIVQNFSRKNVIIHRFGWSSASLSFIFYFSTDQKHKCVPRDSGPRCLSGRVTHFFLSCLDWIHLTWHWLILFRLKSKARNRV